MEKIDIALASDQRYYTGLLVTALSIARHASRDVALRFNVLDGGIEDACWQELVLKLGKEHPHVEIRRFAVDDTRFREYPEWIGSGRMTYARLLLPMLLPEEEFVVYCDVDFLWLADVGELWKLRDQSCILQGAVDINTMLKKQEARWFAENGLTFPDGRYICAGLLILNLALARKRNFSKEVMDFLHVHHDVQYVDQTAINAVVPDIGMLPREWHRFSYELRKREIPTCKVIHFAGDAPWKKYWWSQTLNPSWMQWHRFYGGLQGMSGWQSLRRIYGPCEIFTRRLVYCLVVTPGIRWLFFGFLKLCRRGCYIPYLKEKGGLV